MPTTVSGTQALFQKLNNINLKSIFFRLFSELFNVYCLRVTLYSFLTVYGTRFAPVAGVWSGFDEEWLIKEIMDALQKQTIIGKIRIKFRWRILKWMQKDYWEELEEVYPVIKAKKNTSD